MNIILFLCHILFSFLRVGIGIEVIRRLVFYSVLKTRGGNCVSSKGGSCISSKYPNAFFSQKKGIWGRDGFV